MLPVCSRSAAFTAAIVGILACAAGTHARADGLVRVEPKPYYGAVVTVEHGVRVYRPLPSAAVTVISPDPRTPININYSKSIDNRSYEAPVSAVPADGGYRGGDYGYGYGGLYGGYGYGYGFNRGHQRFGRDTVGRRYGAHSHIRRPKHH